MTLPILQGTYPAGDVYGHSLASAYFNEFRILEPDFAQEREPAVWELIQRDPSVEQAILQRLAVVAPKSWQVEPATDASRDKRLADIVREMLEGVTRFTQARSDLAKAIFRGRAYAFISGRREVRSFDSATRMQRWWMPRRLQAVDKRRIQYVTRRDQQGNIRTVPQLFSVNRRKWEDVRLKGNFVSVVYGEGEESRLGYGRGIIETLYFLWWARMRIMREGLQAVERWSQGFLLAKVDSSVRPGAAGRSPQHVRDEMLSVLKKHRAQHIAVVDAADDISVVTGPTGEHSLTEFWIKYIDDKILAVAMGSVLPFGGSSDTGSLARSITEQSVADDRTELDRDVIDDAIESDLILCFILRNRVALSEEGLDDAKPPQFSTITQEKEDPKGNAEQAEVVLRSGAPLKPEEYYSRVGWEMPDDLEDPALLRAPTTLPGDRAVASRAGIVGFEGTSLPPSPSSSSALSPSSGSDEDGDISPDTESVVESELLGKVGGITGAVEILKNLGEGVITRETAVQLFILFFHLSQAEASKLVGESGQNGEAESSTGEEALTDQENAESVGGSEAPAMAE